MLNRMNDKHDFGPPPPGTGHVRVCRKCGVREPVAGEVCQGTSRPEAIQVLPEHDPYE